LAAILPDPSPRDQSCPEGPDRGLPASWGGADHMGLQGVQVDMGERFDRPAPAGVKSWQRRVSTP
jgi:hypothetical protein